MLRNLDIFQLETLSHTTRRVALIGGGEAFPYSDLSVGRIEGIQRTIPALVSDGITDGDCWYVVNLVDNSNNMSRYVQTVAVLGATSEDQAREWALKTIGAYIGANDAWNTAFTSTKALITYLNRPSTSISTIAIRQKDLDTIAAQITDKPVVWDGANLVSHDPSSLLHELVKNDDCVQMMDAMTAADLPILMVEMGGELAEYDALIVDYNRLDLLMQRLNAAMQKSSFGNVKPVNVTQSKPFKKNGVTNVAALFEMSDGQSVTIVFHSPDNTPAKLAPSDTLTSWKWMLNKRDISAAVSPKNGENVQMPDLAKRILTIVEKNSARFIRANGNKAAQIQELTDTNTRIGQKQEALAGILAVNQDLQKQIDEAGKQAEPVTMKDHLAENYPSEIEFLFGQVATYKKANQKSTKKELTQYLVEDFAQKFAMAKDEVKDDGNIMLLIKLAVDGKLKHLSVSEPANRFAEHDAIAKQYGYSVDNGGVIFTPKGKDTGVKIDSPTGRLKISNAKEVLYTGVNPTGLGKFLESYWYAEKTKAGVVPPVSVEQSTDDGRITPDTAGNMKNGDIVRTKDGTEFMSLGARHDWLEVAPMINGKPQVNNVDTFKFLLSPEKASAYPERRNEPIYPTGKNYYNDNKEQEPVAPVAAPTPAAKSTDLTDEEYAVLKKAYDEFKAKTDKIGAAKSREDALKIATDLVTEMPEKEEQIRRAFSDAIRDNGWGRFEINFPKQPVKVNTDMELNRTLKRLQKALEDTDYSIYGVFKNKFAKLEFAYGKGITGKMHTASIEKRDDGFYNYDRTISNYRDEEYLKPLMDATVDWLNGKNIPKMMIGSDVRWYASGSTLSNSIDAAFKEAKAKAVPAAPVTQPEQAPVASSLETLKKLSKNTEFDSWAIKHGVDEGVAKSILDSNINSALLFGLITHDLPPNDELLKFQDGSILTYYRAKSEDVKSLSDEAFNLLLSQDDYNEKTGYFAYNILRKSNKKAELDYVSSLGAMNNRFRLDAQKYGGKLYKMAQPYLSSQPVEAQPEPASEPPMTNPDRDYLQSIIDGKADLSNGDDVEAKLTDISERLDAELEPMFEQAAEAFAQYAIAQAATV